MLKNLLEELYAQLSEKIEETAAITDPLEKLRTGLTDVQQVLARLKIELGKNGFADEQEEIYFFKHGKPRIYAWLVFITERYAIENAMPAVGKEQQITHLESQLLFINRFFRQNEFLYQYYRLGATDLDDRYFVRNKAASIVGFSEVPEVDPTFSTVADYLFSKFIAYEKLQEYLVNELDGLIGISDNYASVKSKNLVWTGDVVNIVELVYGVYETGQVNEGKASLAELMDYFGHALQINLTKYFKRFSDIKRRKSMSKTRFLDEMTQKVNQRIEDSDAWIPEDQKRHYGY